MHSKSALISLLITTTCCMEHLANLEPKKTESSAVHDLMNSPKHPEESSQPLNLEFQEKPQSSSPGKSGISTHRDQEDFIGLTTFEGLAEDKFPLNHMSEEQFSMLAKNWSENHAGWAL
ncbi:hypothetical protein PGT21_027112 [Puccinia graminis f. sp. tritici]|uniref:Uncharacterized protein n=1 Tax=Puccinia graminis f. sp. tritici TaxID=56615 RepID=A0A5B0RMC8_PUCGR|nr:hypothetical protein PGT21_027112 [Puccinia graminis f. sp. tritici]KAA1127090.1 hypothetical protein PGTUg99_020361 [Puccinia graminis f. sp. tritici]KAA1127091.1 hypothetical protein PGTUg99_020566 [Puccinia graminis f. sp. tritici]